MPTVLKSLLPAALALFAAAAHARDIVLIAGTPSHGPLAHEQNAAVMLLEKWLNRVPGMKAKAYRNGWPADPASALDTAAAIFVFCDGAERHLMFQGDGRAAAAIHKAAARGAGIVLYHFATEPPAQRGHQETLDWIGGFFDLNYSVNPVWEADLKPSATHPAARGVRPFRIRDEWYFNIRFREAMRGITPVLTAVPPPEAITGRPDGPRSGNPDVRKTAGQPQILAWAYERGNGGGRGFGFTGGHFHLNLGDPNFRKLVLNSIVWAAKGKVPRQGIESVVTDTELRENLDPKPARK